MVCGLCLPRSYLRKHDKRHRPSDARDRLESLPSVQLGQLPSPLDELTRLRDAIGLKARLVAKRDDAIPFGFGGNKVRKLTLVAAQALDDGADSLITCGGVQSNHCRATAATAAAMGLECHIVANGTRPERPTGNALLVSLYGANVTYVSSRADRAPMMETIAEWLRSDGRQPFIIPLGASTPLGAMAIARGVKELVDQGLEPDVIVHATSSGGTQAGLIAGCALYSPRTRVIGVSADDSAADIRQTVLEHHCRYRDRAGHGAWGLGRWGTDARWTTRWSVMATGSRPRRHARRRNSPRATKRSSPITGTRPRRWRGSSHERDADEFAPDQTVLFWHTGGQVFV